MADQVKGFQNYYGGTGTACKDKLAKLYDLEDDLDEAKRELNKTDDDDYDETLDDYNDAWDDYDDTWDDYQKALRDYKRCKAGLS